MSDQTIDAMRGTMPLMEHLRELRTRIIRTALSIGLITILLLVFYDPFKDLLTRPYVDLCASRPDFECDGSLFALGPLDGFSARMRICLYGGLILSLPVVLWQIWRFIVPALNQKERRYAVPFILSSVVLFLAGAGIAYWTLGKALEFLIAWSGSDVEQAFQITKYVELVAIMMAAFGIAFLSPVLIVFMQLASVVSPRTLLKQWRMALMINFLLAAVITPSGDPVSMLSLAIPLSVLYFVAVLIGWLFVRRRPDGV